MEGFPGKLDADLELSAAELTLCAAEGSQTLTGVKGLMEALSGGVHAQMQFRLVGADMREPAQIRLVRNRQVSPPASGFELNTGDGELPCGVLAMGLGPWKPLGPRCRFHGYIWANETTDGWEGELTGQLAELDFGGLMTDQFPHHLSGVGEATIQHARFRRGRLEEGSAVLTAGRGTIDRSLLAAAVQCLGLAAGPDLLALPPGEDVGGGDRVIYDQLAVEIAIDARGLRIRGRCPGVESGTILSSGNRRLLGEPSAGPLPVASLVRTLAPASAVQVPVSRQSDWLLRHLPMPEVASLDGVDPPTAHLRSPDTRRR